MARAKVNGVDLYYEDRGEGPPILGLHGTPSSAVMWEGAAVELAKHGRCITYDRRGFLRSGPPQPPETLDLTDHVNDAAALIDALGAAPAVVIGRSTGGQIALELARRFPAKVKALVLLEPAVFTVDPTAAAWAETLRASLIGAVREDPSLAAERMMRDALGDVQWDSWPQELREMFAATSPAVLAELRGAGLDLSDDPRELSREDLAGIDTPTLIVSSEDSAEPFRRVSARLTQLLPHAETVLVPGGHIINPAHEAVLEFIDRNFPGRK